MRQPRRGWIAHETAPRYWIGVVSRQHVLRGILAIGAADFARIAAATRVEGID